MKSAISMLLFAMLLVSMFVLTGCAGDVQQEDATRTVIDMNGKTVELPASVDNYCVLYSSAVGLCGLLDEGYAHVSILPNLWIYQDWVYKIFPALPEQAITVNKRSVTAEQIVQEGAQVVFWSNQSEELIEALEGFGIACVNIAFTSNEELVQATHIVADVFGTEYAKKMSETFCAELENTRTYVNKLATSIPEEERVSVLFLGSTDVMTAYGKPSYEYGWSSALNINYILPEDENAQKVDLTMEQVCEYDPDMIIFEGPVDDEIYNDPIWSELQAAKNGNLIASPFVFDVWPKGGVESIMTYQWAFSLIYPEYAEEIDLKQEIKDFYQTYYGYTMNDEEVATVLTGDIPESE